MGSISKKRVCRRRQGGLPGAALPPSAESRPPAQHYFTIGLGVHLNHAFSKKKPKPGLATCVLCVLNRKVNCSKYERKQSQKCYGLVS